MTLLTAHRILIGSAVVMCLFLAAHDLVASRETDAWEPLVRGIVALAAAVGFGVYWRRIPRG